MQSLLRQEQMRNQELEKQQQQLSQQAATQVVQNNFQPILHEQMQEYLNEFREQIGQTAKRLTEMTPAARIELQEQKRQASLRSVINQSGGNGGVQKNNDREVGCNDTDLDELEIEESKVNAAALIKVKDDEKRALLLKTEQ